MCPCDPSVGCSLCQPNSACPVMREEVGLRCPGNTTCFLAAALLLCCFTACGAFPGTSSLDPRQTKAASWSCVWRRGAPQAVCRARRALTGGTAGQRERLRRPLLAICGKHGPGKGRCLGYSDMPKVSVVGVFGCTGSGKSTICEALAAKVGPDATEIIHGDAFFLPPHLCPPLSLDSLPWVSDRGIPEALARKKNDTNHPGAIDWVAFEGKVGESIASAAQRGVRLLLVDSHLLLQGGEAMLRQFGHFIFVDDSSLSGTFSPSSLCFATTPLAVVPCSFKRMTVWKRILIFVRGGGFQEEELLMRKWARAHLGKPSYQERGVSQDDYRVYFSGYVRPAFLKYGCPQPLPAHTVSRVRAGGQMSLHCTP